MFISFIDLHTEHVATATTLSSEDFVHGVILILLMLAMAWIMSISDGGRWMGRKEPVRIRND